MAAGSNTATTFTLYHPWATLPDATSKFRVFSLPQGAPKLLLKTDTGVLHGSVTSATPRSLTDTSLAMLTDEHVNDLIAVVRSPLQSETLGFSIRRDLRPRRKDIS